MIRTLPTSRRKSSFSIVELLVAMAVLSLIVVMVASITNSTFKLWRSTTGTIKMFSAARTAYSIMSARLGQATLNPYLDYYDVNWNRRSSSLANFANFTAFVPANYGRASDLHCYSGPIAGALSIPQSGLTQQGHGVFFFAPLGYSNNNASYADLPTLLNAVGYYVEFGSDLNYRPSFLGSGFPQKYRWRLIENVLPTQNFTNYPSFTGSVTYSGYMQWMNTSLESANSVKTVLADNVIALIVRPEMSQEDATNAFSSTTALPYNLTTNYIYDTQSPRPVSNGTITFSTSNPSALWYAQLPPLVRVVIVAVDEASARRLTTGTTTPAAFQLSSSWFTNPASLTNDLNSLSAQLNAAHVSYQIFNQLIPIRGAEFSTHAE